MIQKDCRIVCRFGFRILNKQLKIRLMKIKEIPFKYSHPGSRLHLTDRQIELSMAAKPGKVLQTSITGTKRAKKFESVHNMRYLDLPFLTAKHESAVTSGM